ncbi:S9 family peptidase [Rhodococcus sp. BP-149]|uniref:S9 family peptidase n=1 Tax=unclassified Rhodococcus (in: high G+C Gram-positive bacteria) TaxID=192944 RepID=UPI001C9AB553|nr:MULTISPECIES: S9 family peptidase [unclassified Rhodococcus (in: high G+C Gram-positive bacteria)]MBY6685408.1 S9 family peptidase [Rhodococcus sp. BP-288]MBY6696251.1 S9 family peptidase [Rhodococcus sp. BP-188]MBY6696890.1 S9 family peptidase [Rhodococcus sp. BP-285]MBY6703546.1 S9 family peptidase [Rhodococcus sp. BP-283]MBY6707659.1 S9 family peptidase [Rhodococcus sp. BP-241]
MQTHDAQQTTPPIAKTVPHTRTHHGDVVVDPYEWLREKSDPEVVAYLEAENAYTEAQTAHLEPLRTAIFDEIKSRTQETDLSVPTRRGLWWYYGRTLEGKSYGMQCRCPVASVDDWTPPALEPGVEVPGEEIVLDANVLAEGHDFFSLGAFSLSDDGHLLAYSVDTAGDERYTLRIKDLRTGELFPDEIEQTAPGATWSADQQYLFYQTVDDSWRPDKVWRHRIGSPTSEDVVVFHEPDESYWVSFGSTRSEKYLVIWVGSKVTTEGWYLDAQDPTGEFHVILPRRDGVEYSAEHAVVAGRDRFLILHNDVVDGVKAENFVLADAPVEDPSDMTILLEHADDVRLEDVDAFAHHLVLSYRREAVPRMALWPLLDNGYGERHELEFDEELFSVGLGSNPEWDAPLLRFGYTSFITPSRVYDYDLASGERILRKSQPVLGDFDPTRYTQTREWATAEDGTRVPLSVIKRVDVEVSEGGAPTLLYGYGSYEASMDPGFSVSRLSLLDRGIVFVIAHVRGGGEMGRLWYEDGKMLHKKNTFTDFVSCARHLIDTGVTSPDRLVADGGSAGGLLMGAVANLAPELFAGILANVPFVDPLTSILDPSLPLTVIEWDEWGNPLEDKDVYDYMKSYSPYENVAEKDYPAVLAITSINDTRVLYVEPAKWIAALRVKNTGSEPILLKTEMSAGHGGVSGRYEKWKEIAFEYAWVIERTGAIATGGRDTAS